MVRAALYTLAMGVMLWLVVFVAELYDGDDNWPSGPRR
jgi:hypothetical protein